MTKGFRATIVPVSIEREGRFIINAQRLYQTVRVLPDDEITFDIKDNLNCEIYSGRSAFTMIAQRGADFPNLPDLVTERGFTVGAESLRKMITKVVHSVASQDNRPMLCGAFFKIYEGGFEVVSCDGYRLSKCTLKCDVGSLAASGEINYSFIIPGHALGELTKILGEGQDEEVKLYLSRKHAIVNKGDVTFFSRLIDSEYIAYDKIIPTNNDITVAVDRDRFLTGLERANIIAEEKVQNSGRSYVKISVAGHYLNLTSLSANGGVNDEMDCVHEGGDIEIGLNCRFLIDAVKVSEGENIIIKLLDQEHAILIEPTEKSEEFNYVYMILPVKMKDKA
ncbi:MAG: DNA polymerase III subunit beta [Clostridia bacterium]|nr:DNA polymerase III subunit beta [Clostridia bacterium]